MRPNPTFDNRVQQPNAPIYHSEMYQRPVVRSVQVGYQQAHLQGHQVNPQINQQIGQAQQMGQVFQAPNYQVHPMQQVHSQYPQNIPVIPNVQVQTRPAQP